MRIVRIVIEKKWNLYRYFTFDAVTCRSMCAHLLLVKQSTPKQTVTCQTIWYYHCGPDNRRSSELRNPDNRLVSQRYTTHMVLTRLQLRTSQTRPGSYSRISLTPVRSKTFFSSFKKQSSKINKQNFYTWSCTYEFRLRLCMQPKVLFEEDFKKH